jgi:hypothetical protein
VRLETLVSAPGVAEWFVLILNRRNCSPPASPTRSNSSVLTTGGIDDHPAWGPGPHGNGPLPLGPGHNPPKLTREVGGWAVVRAPSPAPAPSVPRTPTMTVLGQRTAPPTAETACQVSPARAGSQCAVIRFCRPALAAEPPEPPPSPPVLRELSSNSTDVQACALLDFQRKAATAQPCTKADGGST